MALLVVDVVIVVVVTAVVIFVVVAKNKIKNIMPMSLFYCDFIITGKLDHVVFDNFDSDTYYRVRMLNF
jgi:hypothetical protein